MATKDGKITLEKLARMVERGFSETKAEMLATRTDVHKFEQRIDALEKTTEYGLDGIAETLKSIREEMKTLDRSAEVHDLEVRVGRLERKVSLKK